MLTKYASAKMLGHSGKAKGKIAGKSKLGSFDYEPRTDHKYLYVAARACTADVPNLNYDMLPSSELKGKEAYRTFIGSYVYLNHDNTDPRKARGAIIDAKYHDEEDEEWVEILMELDEEKCPKLCSLIRSGEIDTFSMGCNIENSTCSVCGNVAEYPFEYCDHINRKGVEYDGKLAYEICNGIEFFEESVVYNPADATAVTQAIGKEASRKVSDIDWGPWGANPNFSFKTNYEIGDFHKFYDGVWFSDSIFSDAYVIKERSDGRFYPVYQDRPYMMPSEWRHGDGFATKQDAIDAIIEFNSMQAIGKEANMAVKKSAIVTATRFIPDMDCSVCIIGDEDAFDIEIDGNGMGYRASAYAGIPILSMPSLLEEYVYGELEDLFGSVTEDGYVAAKDVAEDFVSKLTGCNRFGAASSVYEWYEYNPNEYSYAPVDAGAFDDPDVFGGIVMMEDGMWLACCMMGDVSWEEEYFDTLEDAMAYIERMGANEGCVTAAEDDEEKTDSYANAPRKPEPVPTERAEEPCPLCGSDNFDGEYCNVCGYQIPPEGFDDIKLEDESDYDEYEEESEEDGFDDVDEEPEEPEDDGLWFDDDETEESDDEDEESGKKAFFAFW